MKIICHSRCYFILCYCYEQKNISKFFSMKLIHTRTNQLRHYRQRNTARKYRNRVYQFGVFYDTYIISQNKLKYNYQFKDSFSFHLMSLIKDNFRDVNHIITLLNYHNCLYYNHSKFGLDRSASCKTSYYEEQTKPILNYVFDILIWLYDFNRRIEFTFKLGLDRVDISVNNAYNKICKIIDFANQDLINMVYKIAQQNEKIEEKLTFMVIYNLFLR